MVHYYPCLPEGPSHLSRSQLSRLNPASVYKRLVITLRSLYTYVRVLPAYRMYRACKVGLVVPPKAGWQACHWMCWLVLGVGPAVSSGAGVLHRQT